MAKVKICGIFRDEDIEAVNEGLPDYIGFVFANSRRQVTPKEAARLKEKLDPRILAVGVFVNEDIETILSVGAIDVIQLHGQEDEAYLNRLKLRTSLPIIKATSVLEVYPTGADYLLLDGHTPGSGQIFDWNRVGHQPKDFFLAGGLSPVNIEQALTAVRPYGVDVSSGVETNGVKDVQKIMDFIRKVREYEG